MSLIYDSLKQAQSRRKSNQSLNEITSNQSEGEEVLDLEDTLGPVSESNHPSPQHDLDKDQVEELLIEELKKSNVVSDTDISKVQRMCVEKPGTSFLTLLTRMGIASDTDIAKSLSTILELPLVFRDDYPAENVIDELV